MRGLAKINLTKGKMCMLAISWKKKKLKFWIMLLFRGLTVPHKYYKYMKILKILGICYLPIRLWLFILIRYSDVRLLWKQNSAQLVHNFYLFKLPKRSFTQEEIQLKRVQNTLYSLSCFNRISACIIFVWIASVLIYNSTSLKHFLSKINYFRWEPFVMVTAVVTEVTTITETGHSYFMSLFIYAKKGQWICLNRSNHNLLNIWNKFQLINNSCFLFWAMCSANHACMDWPHDERILVKASQSERTWVSWYLLSKFGHCLLLSHEIDYSATLCSEDFLFTPWS